MNPDLGRPDPLYTCRDERAPIWGAVFNDSNMLGPLYADNVREIFDGATLTALSLVNSLLGTKIKAPGVYYVTLFFEDTHQQRLVKIDVKLGGLIAEVA